MKSRHPLHPAFAHFPVALWAVSLVCDVAALALGDVFWWQAGFWSLAAGLLMALFTVTTGFIEYMTIKPGAPSLRAANFHMAAMSTAGTLFLVSFLVHGGAEPPAGMMLIVVLGCSTLGFGALVVGGQFAADMVYGQGVGARRPTPEAD